MSSRGIIITMPFEFDGNSLSIKGSLDSVSLRQYLLYWDKIDLPDNNIISIGSETPEIQFLKDAGILERTYAKFSSFTGNIGYSMVKMQYATLHMKNHTEPGCWSLAQAGNSLYAPVENTIETGSIVVELYNSIPVPLGDVPLQEILEFKEKRKDELLSFRCAMDDLYDKVAKSGDIVRAKTNAIDKIEKNVNDLNKVFNETWKSKLLSTVKVELNVPNLATAAIAGGVGAASFGFSPVAGAAIGAAGAALKMDISQSRQLDNLPSELKDFAYLHYVEKELG